MIQRVLVRVLHLWGHLHPHPSEGVGPNNTLAADLGDRPGDHPLDILGHRADIAEVRNLAADLLNELRVATQSPEQIQALFTLATDDLPGPAKVAVTQQFNDFMRVHSRVGSVHKLADTLSKLQVMERKAFDIDTPEPGAPGSKGKPVASKTVYELTDDELVADIMARRSKAEQGADA